LAGGVSASHDRDLVVAAELSLDMGRALFMTSFAFILGCVPLWTASGAGAVGRRILGTVVIGGMLTDTLIASLFISVSFYVSERFRRTSPHAATGTVSSPAAISGGAGDETSAGGSRP
jgi:AcrB/AcrD/AcrF family